jgi:acyl-CoA synthetase (AMP-forming)/AMP-acid ligase II
MAGLPTIAWGANVLGTRRADLVTILVNPLHTTRELHHQLVDFGATTLLLPDNFGAVPAAKVRPAAFAGVNTLCDALLNTADFAKLDLSHLKLCLQRGTALRNGTAERWKALTGMNVIEGYGLSETSAEITFNLGRRQLGRLDRPGNGSTRKSACAATTASLW